MCFPGALAADTGGASSLLERGAELGEPSTSGKQEPRDPVPVLPPTHTHCVTSGMLFPLSGPQFPNMPNLHQA